jgi:hypothetical protein
MYALFYDANMAHKIRKSNIVFTVYILGITTVHPDIRIKLSAHQISFGQGVLHLVCGKGGFGLGCTFNMVTTRLL